MERRGYVKKFTFIKTKEVKKLKRKIFSILLALVLVLSMSLVTAVPASATSTTNNNAPTATVGPGQTNVLVMNFTIADGGDVFIDSNGTTDATAGIEDALPGDALADFAAGDNVYYYDLGSDGWGTGDSIWIDANDTVTYEASGRSIGDPITLTTNGYSQGSAVTDRFVIINAINDTIVVYDNDQTSSQTATIDQAAYSGSTLATAVETALNASGTDSTWTVSYSAGDDQFTIYSNDGADDILWSNGASNAGPTLGYDNTDDDNVIVGTPAISDVDVAFNVIAGTNDDLTITIDNTEYLNQTVVPGVYTGTTLAAALEAVIQAVASGTETVDYDVSATDIFTITSATSTLSDDPVDSSVVVGTAVVDIAAGLGLGLSNGGVENEGYVTLADGASDQISLNIDGVAQADIDLVDGDTDYDDADTLVTAIQTAMDIAYAAVVATVSWDTDHLVIQSDSTTGSLSTVVVTAGTTNDATATIYGTPTEWAGDSVIIGTPTTESTTGSELSGSDDIKYVGSGSYSSGDDIIEDIDDNGTYRDQLNAITLQDNLSNAGNTDFAVVEVWAENGPNPGFQSGEDTTLGTATWVSNSWDLSGLSQAIPAAGQQIYVTVDIAVDTIVDGTIQFKVPTPVDGGDSYEYNSGDQGLFFASTDVIGNILNENQQTIDSPTMTVATTADTNSDGIIDQLTVTFEEAMTITDGDTGDGITGLSISSGDWTITDGEYAMTASTTLVLNITSTTFDTSTVLDLVYDLTAGTIVDGLGYNLSEANSENKVDGAAPVAISAAYKDTDPNGTVNRVDVTYSESISGSAFETGDWAFPTNPHTLVVDSGTISGADVQITVTGGPSDNTALDTTTVQYTDNVTTGSITDGTNTAATSSVLTVSDAAAPVVIDAVAEDTTGNGYLDKITLTMSETVASNNPTTAAFVVDDTRGNPLTEESVGAGGASTTSFTSTLSTVVVELSDDTGKTGVPALTYTSGETTEVQDLAANVLANVSPTVTDSARPTIMDLDIEDTNADGLIDKIIVTFSERIDTDNGDPPLEADFGTTITLPDGSTANLSGATIEDPAGGTFTVDITGITGQVTQNTAAGSTGISGDLSLNWKDLAGNALVTTLDDETVTDSALPVIIDREAQLGSAKVTVKFSEGVYSVNDETGALDKDDFGYPNANSTGAASITSVSHIAGRDIAVLILDVQVIAADTSGTPDTINAVSGAIFDVGGLNAADTAVAMVDLRNALSLVDGWNLVSIPKVASSGWNIINNVTGTIEDVYIYDNGGWSIVTDANSLDAVFIKADGPQELALEWWTIDIQIAPPTKALEAGWNLVGANMDPPTEIDVVLHVFLDSVSDSYSTVFNPGYNLISPWTVVYYERPFSVEVLPYEGYWIYMTAAAELAGRTL